MSVDLSAAATGNNLSAPITFDATGPWTIALWAQDDDIHTTKFAVSLTSEDQATDNAIAILTNSSLDWLAYTRVLGTATYAQSDIAPSSAGAWSRILFQHDPTYGQTGGTRLVMYDANGKYVEGRWTSVDLSTMPALTRLYVGHLYNDSSNAVNEGVNWDGRITYLTVWDVCLTQEECIDITAFGLYPASVRVADINQSWDLRADGNSDVGGTNLTTVGTIVYTGANPTAPNRKLYTDFPFVAETKGTVNVTQTTHNIQMPDTVYDGDLILVLFTCFVVSGPSLPSGFVASIGADNYDITSGSAHHRFWWKIGTRADSGAIHTCTTNSACTSVAAVSRIEKWGGTLSTTYIKNTSGVSIGSGTVFDPNNCVAGWGRDNNLWLIPYLLQNDDQTAPAPANYTKEIEQVSGQGTNAGATAGLFSRQLTASAENPDSITPSVGFSNVAAHTVAIRPGDSGGPPPVYHYCTVYEAGNGAAATDAQVKAGTGTGAVTTASGVADEDADLDLEITGLTPGVKYDIEYVISDGTNDTRIAA